MCLYDSNDNLCNLINAILSFHKFIERISYGIVFVYTYIATDIDRYSMAFLEFIIMFSLCCSIYTNYKYVMHLIRLHRNNILWPKHDLVL